MKIPSYLASVVAFSITCVAAQKNDTEEFCGYTAINGLVSGRNNQKCGALLDDAFLPFNAMYIGNLTLALTGNAPACPQNTYTMPNYTVGIGPQSVAGNSSFTRAGYDKNPFYLWFKYQEDKKIAAGFLSSSDYFLTESQWWTLTSTKNGNGFDIGGSYTGKLAPRSNVYNYPTDEKYCWRVNIYNHIVKAEVLSKDDNNHWTITGRLESDKIHIVIDQFIMWKGIEYHSIFTYDGVPDVTPKLAARLVTTESVPTTDLALKGTANASEAAGAGGAANSTKGSDAGRIQAGNGIVGMAFGVLALAGMLSFL